MGGRSGRSCSRLGARVGDWALALVTFEQEVVMVMEEGGVGEEGGANGEFGDVMAWGSHRSGLGVMLAVVAGLRGGWRDGVDDEGRWQ